jgi:hypothetical protein
MWRLLLDLDQSTLDRLIRSLTQRVKGVRQMTKRLSEQLADLSAHAKSAENAFDAADKKAHDKVVALQKEAHAAATKAVEKVNQDAKSISDNATRNWNALKAKISEDMSQ